LKVGFSLHRFNSQQNKRIWLWNNHWNLLMKPLI